MFVWGCCCVVSLCSVVAVVGEGVPVKKDWDRRISQASQMERGLQSPSCSYRCAGRWESAWEWVKECMYQAQIFPCVLCSVCGRAKKKRSTVAVAIRSETRQARVMFIEVVVERQKGALGWRRIGTWTDFLRETALATRETEVQMEGLIMCGKELFHRVFPRFHSERHRLP
jgi:hypothetical protein